VPVDPALYRRHRFPVEIISHAVWLYFRFNLSHRDVLSAQHYREIMRDRFGTWQEVVGSASRS
jgi:putative transposase